jgi:hypothetical protein
MDPAGTTLFNEGVPEIQRDEIQFEIDDKKSLLGEGSFGSVYKVAPACESREPLMMAHHVSCVAVLLHSFVVFFCGLCWPRKSISHDRERAGQMPRIPVRHQGAQQEAHGRANR